MIIYAVQDRGYEGIVEQHLFIRECSAKAYCRKLNKKQGYNTYEVVSINVNEE